MKFVKCHSFLIFS